MEILRKRTFLEETASAKVEANSGDTAMPDVADMMERTDARRSPTRPLLIATLMNTPPYVPYQAYKVRPCLYLLTLLTEFVAKKAKETFSLFLQQQAVCLTVSFAAASDFNFPARLCFRPNPASNSTTSF
jgi:hypothetical protein